MKKTKNTNSLKKQRKAKPAVTWEATEHTPRKRWWWYLIIVYVAILLTAVLILSGNWMLAALVAVMTVAVIYTYSAKPRTRRYELRADALLIDDARVDLAQFDRSVIEDPWRASASRAGIPVSTTLLLLPRKRLSLPLSIFLPDDADETVQVLNAMTSQVPLTEQASYQGVLRVLDWMIRKLGL